MTEQLPTILIMGGNMVIMLCVLGTLRQILDELRVLRADREALGVWPERMS